MGANLCLKNINDKHSPTKGINVIITDKITIKAKEIAQCRELVSILYILLFINITNSYLLAKYRRKTKHPTFAIIKAQITLPMLIL